MDLVLVVPGGGARPGDGPAVAPALLQQNRTTRHYLPIVELALHECNLMEEGWKEGKWEGGGCGWVGG